MKKLVSFILLIALVCSLCVFAPSAAALSEEEEALYTKYADLITLLEEGEFETALDFIWGLMPAREFEEVAITPENFFDYYEESVYADFVERDADGNITSIYPGDVIYVLKDEYLEKVDFEKSTVTIGVTGEFTLTRVKIDWESGERTLGDKAEKAIRSAAKKYAGFDSSISVQASGAGTIYLNTGRCFYGFSSSTLKRAGNAVPGEKLKYYEAVPSGLELVSVEGTLYLVK